MDHEVQNSIDSKLDKYFKHKYLGIPIFLFVMYILFQATFTVSKPFIGLIEQFFVFLSTQSAILLASSPSWLISLISESIIGGIGSVIIFFPNIFFLFFFISLLQDSGYLSRASFSLDKFMSKIGLNSKSFIPLILGFGCNVPAILASKTIENKRDRILTILISPFISCSARLPIYVLFTSIFFSKHEGLVIFSVYLIGIVMAIFSGLILKKTIFKGNGHNSIIKLPSYKIPKLSKTLRHTWLETKMFIKKAGTIIFAAAIFIWLFSSLPFGVEYASKESVIGQIGQFLAPIFAPLGFGFWEAAVALIFGLIAKEIVIGSFGTIYGEAALGTVLAGVFTPLSAYSFMIFVLLYIPCVATLAAIRRELNTKWMIFASLFLLSVAYLVSLIVYQGGLLFLKLFSI
ncbi:ferrous iron transport protein B [Candidatus Venteria ishoeyi]|uniref:Ferrous iron transport protein B n=1 Tax=Candidatus Venteria ishoeyi TaxID=1899563 RepID=A0A1H6F6K7_9GAMM|nr:ferrous iron transport protein B [Candidatus Venteria ishoeyi]SEH05163.1 Ferrous iron transport protein B [Candidatus Venteria ishoeyi]